MDYQSRKLAVAVCGAGIAGLTFAIALAKASNDFDIQVYEAAHELAEIGAGVWMWQRPWKVIEALGLREDLRHIVLSPLDDKPHVAFRMRKSDQQPGIYFHELKMPMGNLGFHRADFQKALGKALDPAKVTTHFKKRLVSYEQDSPLASPSEKTPIKLKFADGSTAECDILVGADGVYSATRHTLLNDAATEEERKGNKEKARSLLDMIDPVWSGWVAYRTLIAREELEKFNPHHSVLKIAHNYIGKNRHLIAFPIEHEGSVVVNFVGICYSPDKEGTVHEGKTVEDVSERELLEQFSGWEDEAQQILKCVKKPSKWVINALKPLTMNVHGRVALIGDAAHAMTPHQGSGAGQAIEDAYVLAAVLGHCQELSRGCQSAEAALLAYETVRLPFGNEVHHRSRLNGRMFDLADEPNSNNLSEADLKALAEKITKNWEWAWTTSVEDDKTRALQILEKKLNQATWV